MKVNNIYTSISCNRTVECADWGNNNLIVFGAGRAVAILDPKFEGNSAKILHTYVKHSKRVNTVQWLSEIDDSPETYFISGSDDGLAILWCMADAEAPLCYPLKGHEHGVYNVTGLKVDTHSWLLATASSDSIRIWHFDGATATCKQIIPMKEKQCFGLNLTLLPQTSQTLLVFGGDDGTVSLWAQRSAAPEVQYELAHRLTGHQDWVRGLSVVADGNDLLLASCCQDTSIRMWRIAPRTTDQVRDNAVDIFRLNKDDSEIRVEEKILELGGNCWYAVSLESVLYGHEGWVYGVHWHKSKQQGLLLLSASVDKSLIIWAPSAECGVWLENVRVGEMGGNTLGFYGGKFAIDGKSIFGYSYQGDFHIWQQSSENEFLWQPQVIVGGHYDEVRDLSWEPEGAYLMTVSADQTTRLHAPWQRRSGAKQVTWHEFARPQVHGYDMQALALLSRYKFASGAEEKIVRTFQTSTNFIENFRHLSCLENDPEGDALLASLPKGASVPSLGLSNKAVYKLEEPAAATKHVKDEYPENYFVPVQLQAPPQEDTLMQNTLWPEVQKLYGHGFEIYALASTPDGQLLASACRASTAEHAQIILWNTNNWKQVQKLPFHQSTVTQLRFSPDGRYLLSVSRDRRWALFERQSDDAAQFSQVACTDKTNGLHTRVIWTCDWSHDSAYFVTASREGRAVVWTHTTTATEKSSLNGWQAVDVLELKNNSITAVAFAHNKLSNDAYLVALGFESGLISLYQFDGKFTLLHTLAHNQAHNLTVRRLQFRPTAAIKSQQFQLASCGNDHLVRIYELTI